MYDEIDDDVDYDDDVEIDNVEIDNVDYDDSMDGDFDTAMASAGMGTDEDAIAAFSYDDYYLSDDRFVY